LAVLYLTVAGLSVEPTRCTVSVAVPPSVAAAMALLNWKRESSSRIVTTRRRGTPRFRPPTGSASSTTTVRSPSTLVLFATASGTLTVAWVPVNVSG
jgi:hypothetical protein